MFYVDSKGKRRRANGFQLTRRRGVRPADYVLMLLVNSASIPTLFKNGKCDSRWHGFWHIPLKYEGKLATTAPDFAELVDVSYREIPEDVQLQVRTAIEYIREHGTPFENDEHVFGN